MKPHIVRWHNSWFVYHKRIKPNLIYPRGVGSTILSAWLDYQRNEKFYRRAAEREIKIAAALGAS